MKLFWKNATNSISDNFVLNKDISNSQSPSPHKTNQRRRVHGGAIEKRISEKVRLYRTRRDWSIFVYFKGKSDAGAGRDQARE